MDAVHPRDRLLGALIGLARAADHSSHLTEHTQTLILECLAREEDDGADALIDAIHAEKRALLPDCGSCEHPCGRSDDFDTALLARDEPDTRALKALLLYALRGMANDALRARALGRQDGEADRLLRYGLFLLGEEARPHQLQPILVEIGTACLRLTAQLRAPATPGEA